MVEAFDMSKATPENTLTLRKTLHKGVYKPPKGVELDKSPTTYRRDLLHDFIFSKPLNKLQEITELENIYGVMKGTHEDMVYKRKLQGKMPTPLEIAYFRLLTDTLERLHKIKYGEKKMNLNVGVSHQTLQDMMFGPPPEKEENEQKMP